MAKRLPILISIPHGGDVIAHEVKDRVHLTARDIFFDGDAKTREIYNFKNEVEAFIEMPIARAIIDVNRASNDRPPKNPDGVIKTITTDKKEIYKQNKFPDDLLIEQLLEKYYFPFHNKIDRLLEEHEIILALDCHSMLAEAPPISKDAGKPRPLISLSNRGDIYGEPTEERGSVTCPPEWIYELASSFKDVFGEQGEITINDPFTGGFNSQLHFKNNGIPWIQVEINRNLYLSELYFNEKELTVEKKRLEELRELIFSSIKQFIGRLFKNSKF